MSVRGCKAMVLAVALAGCDLTVNAGEQCAQTCAGCCTAAGRCDLGTSDLACGGQGSACQPCGTGLVDLGAVWRRMQLVGTRAEARHRPAEASPEVRPAE